MALIKCKECGKEVSSKADKCPNCGVDIKRKPAGCGTLLALLLFIAVMGNVWDSVKNDTAQTKPTENKSSEAEKKQAALDRDASMYCTLAIQSFAKYDYRWTDGFLSPKFSNVAKKNPEGSVLIYSGDQIEMQNGFGAWVRHAYHCDMNAITGEFVSIRIEPGRL